MTMIYIMLLSMPNAFAQNAAVQSVKRSISLEWEEVPDSTGYQIEVRKIRENGERGKPMVFPTKKSIWEGKIFSGKYEMRLRSLDDRGVPGDWSDPSEFWVKIPAAEPVLPKDGSQLNGASADESEVKFEWRPVSGAAGYRLEVLDSSGQVVQSKDTTTTKETVNLKVAQTYQWRVISLMKEGNEPGELPEKNARFLHIGTKLEKPKIDKPTTKFVTEVNWSAPEHASKYSYILMRKRADGKWAVVERKVGHDSPKIPVNPNIAGGNFRIQVRAMAENRITSDVSTMDFFVFQGVRTPAAVETAMLKEAIEKDYNHYFIASYLLSNVIYEGKNAEVGNRSAKYDALAGTGRLGYGYIPKGQWGAIAIVDMSGVIINNENNLYASSELSAVWRTYIMKATQFRAYGGGYLKQTPELKCQTPTDCKAFNVTHVGPQGGIQIWHPFTYKFGLQVNSQAYYSAMGIQTPNAKDLIPSLSYQVGAMGSYKLKENMTGFAGYAYRVDTISYKAKSFEEDESSLAEENSKNDVKMTGHFLNLYLEWGF